jgi:hypothetical protein
MGKRRYLNQIKDWNFVSYDKVARRDENIANMPVVPQDDTQEDVEVSFPFHDDYDDDKANSDDVHLPFTNNFNDTVLVPPLYHQLMQLEQNETTTPEDEYNYHFDDTIQDDISDDNDVPLEKDINPSLKPKFSVIDTAMIELILYCNKAGTPLKFLDGLLQILKRHIRLGFDINKAPKRSNFMSDMRARVGSPIATPVVSPKC